MYKFNDYRGLMSVVGKGERSKGMSVIERDFSEQVEIIEEDLKVPYFLFRGRDEVTYYLDVMIEVKGHLFYTCKRFLTEIDEVSNMQVERGIKLGWDESWEGIIIQIGYRPTRYGLLVTNDYCDSKYQLWNDDLWLGKGATLKDFLLKNLRLL